MGWLLTLIAVGIFLWLLVNFPQFQIAVGLLVAALLVIYFYWTHVENKHEAKSRSLISPSQLALGDVTLAGSHGVWEVKGTIKNNSPHTLTGFKLKITVRDCPENSGCIVIGEDNAEIYGHVPPSQLRAFDDKVSLSHMPNAKKMEWDYQLIQATADTD